MRAGIPLDSLFTRKTPPRYPNVPEEAALSWEVWVPMATNPLFLVDAGFLFLLLWALPSLLAALCLLAAGRAEAIFFVVSWIGMCVALLAGCTLFFVLIRFGNGCYVRYTLNSTGVSSETAQEVPLRTERPRGRFFGLRALPLARGSIATVATEKWAAWNKIQRVKAFPALRAVTLSDSFLPVFRLYCADDAMFGQTLELCRFMLDRRTAPDQTCF